MAVYIDYLFEATWRYGPACRLTADTLVELHAMAERIGLKQSWFQKHPRIPHYDLTKEKRQLALAAGAIERRRPAKAI